MIRQPPRSTLFPYPTLSRSGDRLELGDRRFLLLAFRRKARTSRWRAGRRWRADPRQLDRLGLGEQPRRAPLDRKSTRLNSSHANISYAVFCLKKKKNKRTNRSSTLVSSSSNSAGRERC